MSAPFARKRPFEEADRIDPSLQESLTLLKSVVGQDVSDVRLLQLLKGCKGDVQLAANAYFSSQTSTTAGGGQPEPISDRSTKYIGNVLLSGWFTSSNQRLLREGDRVVFQVQENDSSRRIRGQREKVNLVRVYSARNGNFEFGRLNVEEAKIVSDLMDLGLCTFDPWISFSPAIHRTGAEFLLEARVYIYTKVFAPPNPPLPPTRENIYTFRDTAPEDQRLSRARTVALIRILARIGKKPSHSIVQRMNIEVGADDDHIRNMIAESVATDARPANAETSGEYSENTEEADDTREVSDDQLNDIYSRAHLNDNAIHPTPDPPELSIKLKPYQQIALTWMANKEAIEEGDGDTTLRSMHPLWEEYAFTPVVEGGVVPSDEPQFYYFNPYTGELSLDFPEINSLSRGGILADEMGLGKTIEILSLIHHNKGRRAIQQGNHQGTSPTTLVVCPTTLLSQWHDELVRNSFPESLQVMVYYGDTAQSDAIHQRLNNPRTAPDVLITTYGSVVSDFKRSRYLFGTNFYRIVLDEAHHIKNRHSQTSIACTALQSVRRWAVTGTPIQNKLEDLYSLVRFICHEPWSNYTFWRTFITIPFERKDPKALNAVKSVLEPLVLRRTKNMRTRNGELLVPLPKKTINVAYLRFSAAEQDIYDSLYTDSKVKFNHFCAAGKALSNYASIFQLLMRLRQVACHPYLVLGKEAAAKQEIQKKGGGMISLENLIKTYENSNYASNILQQLLQQGESDKSEFPDECPICYEAADTMMLLPCAHMICRPCVMDYLQKKDDEGEEGDCPFCRQGPVDPEKLYECRRSQDKGDGKKHKIDIRRAVDDFRASTKIDKLVELLHQYRSEGRKTVVFSQFTSFLDIIEIAMQREQFKYTRLDGALRQADREKVLTAFKSTKDVNILLISLRAGGVGLNLTCASRVIMLDPWWNFAVEAQAIDRIHRLGQEEDVVVTRFIVKDTVEERILEIQNNKHALVTELYLTKDEARTSKLQDLNLLFQ
ncbi:SNF2 family N-terminal domain-domain-containing protein [Syncephalastrum racemosum]|uniref:SNF2 family N-terminal domain-domain-containing protein n=1 Tax=Syncephalastrum racemosum TaxID=13706 RepID=A0A1X2H9Z5_SYNRA|nr:SNF2 family N-terminal domain-domain-containing protein [Syncephalastrum racemosum]